MIFSSELFLFTFLPAFLAAYYAIPFRARSLLIVVASYIFYAWWRVDFLVLLLGMTAWVYGFGKLIHSAPDARRARLYCTAGVVGCLAVLGVFKYFNFSVDTLAAILGRSPADLGVTMRILLPIGVSFFVFHAISYLIDIHRKEVPPADNIIDFAAFMSLFPHLIAGPVLRYKDLSAQIRQREHSFGLFAEGLRWFVFGLAKKVMIADSVAPMADAMFALKAPSFTESWLGAVAYTVQIYFDFSGYSEMAVGLGLMIGIRFIQNFNFPYISRSITEFWSRWHISLSVWLRDYVYIPMGGNRGSTTRTYANLLITMLIGGLWHGANWTFVLWGALHGGMLALERACGLKSKSEGRPFVFLLSTMTVVVVAWVLFRAPDFATALAMYRGMIGLNGFDMGPDAAWQVGREQISILLAAILIIYVEPHASRLQIPSNDELRSAEIGWRPAVVAVSLAVICIMRISEQSFSPFLYFQF
jgi:alginate O-acetyltransferase complex protein AlgI